MKMRFRNLALVVMLLILIKGGIGEAAAWITLDPPGSTFTEPHAIDGSRVVGEYSDASGPYQSFLFDGTTWTKLTFPGATYTFARDIDGTDIVGYYVDTSGHAHGFLYDGSTWITLDYPGASQTYLFGIDSGNIVGNCNTAGGIMYDGAIWSILSLPESGLTVMGIDGNNIIVARWSYSFVYDGATWTKLVFPGANSTEAHGIDGNYIVGEYNIVSSSPDHGFLYDATTWSTLDFPGAGGTIAFDIDDGFIVGRYLDSFGKHHGFIYAASIVATVEIDPDTLNLDDKGNWITCYIELPVWYSVNDIDIESVLLEDLLEVQHSDVQGSVLMVKFDRQDLIAYLEVVLGITPPVNVNLMVTGELAEGPSFEGTDVIRVIDEGN